MPNLFDFQVCRFFQPLPLPCFGPEQIGIWGMTNSVIHETEVSGATEVLQPSPATDEVLVPSETGPRSTKETTRHTPTTSDKTSLNSDVERRIPWRPFYLRRRVLSAFCILFLALVIILETLLAISERRQGLTSSTSDLRFLWTLGPTAVVTLLAALWSRVEYQAR